MSTQSKYMGDPAYSDELWDEEIKRRARVEFQKRRDQILEMNVEAIVATADQFVEHAFDRDGKATRRFVRLIHTAFNGSSELLGREFLAMLIESMNEVAYQRAIESMDKVAVVKRPVGDTTRAALEAVIKAVAIAKQK